MSLDPLYPFANQHAIQNVVETITYQHELCGRGVAMLIRDWGMAVLIMPFAHIDMAMAPQHEFFQQEEHQDADENREANRVNTFQPRFFYGMRQ